MLIVRPCCSYRVKLPRPRVKQTPDQLLLETIIGSIGRICAHSNQLLLLIYQFTIGSFFLRAIIIAVLTAALMIYFKLLMISVFNDRTHFSLLMLKYCGARFCRFDLAFVEVLSIDERLV